MRKIIIAILLLVALSSPDLWAQGSEHRIVFQFTLADSLQQKAFSNQLKNLRKHWPEASIEVVAYNQGIEFLMNERSQHKSLISDLKKSGVKFVVCANTMKQRDIKAEQLMSEAEIIPSGIAEIVEKQEKGWSYIKGGF